MSGIPRSTPLANLDPSGIRLRVVIFFAPSKKFAPPAVTSTSIILLTHTLWAERDLMKKIDRQLRVRLIWELKSSVRARLRTLSDLSVARATISTPTWERFKFALETTRRWSDDGLPTA